MSNIDLEIGGRRFSVSCTPGEEAHITALGQLISAKIATMPGASGQSEARMLLFGALLLADELHELKEGKAPPPPPPAPPIDTAMAEKLEAIAETLENCALHLESGAAHA